MSNSDYVRHYLRDLIDWFGSGWNQFWYAPAAAERLVWLRQIVAVFAFVWLASFSLELVSMFGPSGWLSREVVHQATTDGDLTQFAPGISHLFLFDSSILLWTTHLLSLAVVGAMVLGIAPRITSPLTLLVVLSYIHRAPVVVTAFETVLCMLLLYVSLGPNQTIASLRTKARNSTSSEHHWLNNLAIRLIQVHLCLLYVLIAASKLGTPDWWTGAAFWYLLTDEQHRLLNLEFLTSSRYLMDLLSHAWVAFEILFPVLIWNRRLSPLLVAVATLVWIFTAVVTGQIGYSLLMIVANIAFIAPSPGRHDDVEIREPSKQSRRKSKEPMAASKP